MSYDVTLVLTIYDKGRKRYSAGYRELTLPFVPFVGLSIENGAVGLGSIEAVEWLETQSRFKCSIRREQVSSDDDIPFLVGQAKKQGYCGFEAGYEI